MSTQAPARAAARRRLMVRSIISATLPIGWSWAAVTALIPYFLIGHGAGTSSVTALGATRAVWMSLHVWSTFAMVLLTVAHALLNRRGVVRSYRIVGGLPNKASSEPKTSRGWAWIGAALLVLIVTIGGLGFAVIDDTHPDGGGPGRNEVATADEASDRGPAARGRGNGRR